ncbi:MAG TPA: HD domain-containing phosphohydrolase [Urbifossiella sp.]|jgi:putative nucleotidyltransferase with HDIG domain|nr:HD domain-containing phosphohydrolase [Urbifossiella sp.]
MIRMRGISPEVKGKIWESSTLLRAGRLASLEIVLDDSSVSRRHAEVRLGDDGWHVRDLESTNGTYVNGVRIGSTEQALCPRDIVQFGKVAVVVDTSEATLDGPSSHHQHQHVLATATSSYEQGLRRLAYDRNEMPRAGDQLLALLRAGHHFSNTQNEDQLLDNILNDAVSVLDAQRGAIVLADGDGPEPQLHLRALAVGRNEAAGRFHYSKKLTHRVLAKGESILYGVLDEEHDSMLSQSVMFGAMDSVICALLRTPRRRIGVLHLDRCFGEGSVHHVPFTEDDLHLADAFAAHVSAAIEGAALFRKQKEQYHKTIEVLASAVELRDDYTYGHTKRVTRYAEMLARQLELPEDQLELIRLGTPLHDIGKIGIDDAILRKPGRLTAEEFAKMQEHTTKGAEILSMIPEMHSIIPIVRNHHERWDGTGYPDRLAGPEIPFLARIVAVADAFDAMTSHRPYHEAKKPKTPEMAFAELERMAGRQFDPRCAAAFLDIRKQVVQTMIELMPDCNIGEPEPAPATMNEVGAPTPPPISTRAMVETVVGLQRSC